MLRKIYAVIFAFFVIGYISYLFPEIYHLFDDRPRVKILFIGNSHTYYHNMPSMLEEISYSQKDSPKVISASKHTIGAANLKRHWHDGIAADQIRNEKWDYVVLQEQSDTMLFRNERKKSKRYFSNFHKIIKESGAKTIIYATWPKKPGHRIYRIFKTDYNIARETTNHSLYDIARKLGANIIYTSMIWDSGIYNKMEMYRPDGNHASKNGSYLVALEFYKHLFPNHKINYDTLYIADDLDRKEIIKITQQVDSIKRR